jgi:hypothetical protein
MPTRNSDRYKFIAIHSLLLTHEVVLFADGDVVFLRPEFIGHVLRAVDGVDVAAQCDLMVTSSLLYLKCVWAAASRLPVSPICVGPSAADPNVHYSR